MFLCGFVFKLEGSVVKFLHGSLGSLVITCIP